MSTDSLDKQLEALRDGDEHVASALAALDAKLEQWLAFMQAGQAVVVDGLAKLACADGVAESPAAASDAGTAEAVETVDTVDVVAADEVIEPAEAVTQEAVVEPAVAEAAAETPTELESTLVDGEPEPAPAKRVGGMFQRPTTQAGDEAGISGMEAEQLDGHMDDEALLASLDEETAAAIRVKRRLCNNQRGVRELLEEMRREKPASDKKAQQRKTWWR